MDTKPKIKLFIAVPTTSTVYAAQTYVLRDLEKTYGDIIEFIYPDDCVHRIFHDFARNELVREFQESGADCMWFLDSDVVPPVNVLNLIRDHYDKWQVAGAPYPVFMQQPGCEAPQVVFTVYKDTPNVGMAPAKIPYSGTDFAEGMATGCLFIKREVFDKLEKPYYEFKYEQENRLLIEGEDIGFCKKLRAQGIKFFVDYSLVCRHYKTVCLLDVNNYALEMSNRAIQAYDRVIKEKVMALATARSKIDSTPQRTTNLILPNDFR